MVLGICELSSKRGKLSFHLFCWFCCLKLFVFTCTGVPPATVCSLRSTRQYPLLTWIAQFIAAGYHDFHLRWAGCCRKIRGSPRTSSPCTLGGVRHTSGRLGHFADHADGLFARVEVDVVFSSYSKIVVAGSTTLCRISKCFSNLQLRVPAWKRPA